MWTWINLITYVLLFGMACDNVVVETNEPPTPPVFSVEPEYPNGLDNVKVILEEESVDPNNHKLTYKYLWYKDGLRQYHITGAILPFFETSSGENWEVEAYVTEVCICEPLYKSKPFSFSFTIENTPPYMTEVQIDPISPRSDESLTVLKEFVDEEGDQVEFFYIWLVNNIPMLCCVGEVSPDMTTKGERWGVLVYPSDSEEGFPLFHQVTIRNTPPIIIDVQYEVFEETIENVDLEQGSLSQNQYCIELYIDGFDSDEDNVVFFYNLGSRRRYYLCW